MEMIALSKSYSIEYPLKMDNATLLHFVNYYYRNQRAVTPYALYDSIIEGNLEYAQLVDNPELLRRLHVVLEADHQIRIFVASNRYHFSDSVVEQFRKLRTRKQANAELAEMEAKRKKAHDAYEMLRKLCFGHEGQIFKLEFT